MSIQIIYKGFTQETSPAEAISILSRALNGDKAKAEEAFITPNYVLRTISSKAEVGLILPRLEKLGLRCEVVEGGEAASGTFQSHEVVTRMVACKFCGYEQALAKVCRKCAKPFAAVKKIDWKPAVQIEREEDVEISDEDHVDSLMDRIRGWHIFTTRNAVIVIAFLGVLVGMGILNLPGDESDEVTINAGETGIDADGNDKSTNGIDDDENGLVDDYRIVTTKSSSSNPILMIMKGIATSDPNEVKKTATYDPESGENPYAKRLESLGIDQKEFSKVAAGIEGPIEGAEVQGIIDSNEMLKGAIDDAINSSGTSAGDTDTDKMIDSIQ